MTHEVKIIFKISDTILPKTEGKKLEERVICHYESEWVEIGKTLPEYHPTLKKVIFKTRHSETNFNIYTNVQ